MNYLKKNIFFVSVMIVGAISIFSFSLLDISTQKNILKFIKSQTSGVLLSEDSLNLNTGLIGHWKFDEDSGTTASDSSGNGYNGTFFQTETNQGPAWNSSGKIGSALSFDGTDDFVDLGDISTYEFGPDESFTFSFWINPAAQVSGDIFGRRGQYDGRSAWYIKSSGSYYSFVMGDGTNSVSQNFTAPEINKWSHCAIVVGKTGEDINIYINGALNKTFSRTIGRVYQDITSFKIGSAKTNYTPTYFNGLLDDVRIYNRALNPEEVVALSQGQTGEEQSSYNVTITTEGNGTISPQGTIKIDADSNVEFKITPDKGYKISDVLIDGASKGGPDTFTIPYLYTLPNINKDTALVIKFAPFDIPSFPGAEGFGAKASGGRGGKIIHVTNLNDSGPGSFREALNNTGPRIIVFDVGGNIELKSDLELKPLKYNKDVPIDDFTIAGQTAPGGITLSGAGLVLKSYAIVSGVSLPGSSAGVGEPLTNFIVRHIRLRGLHNYDDNKQGEGKEKLTVTLSDNYIFDHVTVSGGVDQTFNIINEGSYTKDKIIGYPIGATVQYSSIEEASLYGQGGANHWKGNHNLATYIVAGKVSFHHNIIANSAGRAPLVTTTMDKDAVFDMRNNVMYNNWGGEFTYGSDPNVCFNIVNNVYSQGPIYGDLIWYVDKPVVGKYYPRNFEGNIWYKGLDPETAPESVWGALRKSGSTAIPDFINIGTSKQPNSSFSDTPASAPYVTTESAENAFNTVLNKAGAWPRDFTTHRTVEEIRTKTAAPGLHGPYEYFPEAQGPCSIAFDTDRDGMPSDWESSHGLDPNNPSDGNKIVQAGASPNDRYKDYTYVEYYLGELADNIVGQEGRRYTIKSAVSPADSGSVVPYHGSYDNEDFAQAGYNASFWVGDIPFGTAEFNNGSMVIMKAKPRPGYVFDHWSGGLVDGLTSIQVKFPANSDADITANFKPLASISITTTVSPDDSGNVSGAGDYSIGDIVTLAAYSNDGYKFKKWIGGSLDGTTNPVVQFSATEGLNITAEFEPGNGGDVLLDDFNDQNIASFLNNSDGQAKQWSSWGTNMIFYEVGSGNYAYGATKAQYKGRYANLTLGISGGNPETATSDIPQGVTVLKMRIHNVGDKTTNVVPVSPYEKGYGIYWSFNDRMQIYLDKSLYAYWTRPIGPLFYDKPFKFPIIEPGKSAIFEIPLNLVKNPEMTVMLKPGGKFKALDFGNIFGIWGSPIAVDDVAFGRASTDAISSPNLAPVADAGKKQTTKDCDNDGKEVLLLNGLKSYDQDAGLIKTWTWKENGAQIATGFAPSVDLGIGTHNIELTITDESGLSSNSIVNVVVLKNDAPPPPVATTFTITASAGQNGSISPSGSVSVDEGANRVFTISAGKGYHIADVKVDDKSEGAVSSYEFKNVKEAHSISASFEKDDVVIITPTPSPDTPIDPCKDLSNPNKYKPTATNLNLEYDKTKDISNLADFLIQKTNTAEIFFLEALNLIHTDNDGCYQPINIDNATTISLNKVKIDSTSYPELNRKARIKFFNITASHPQIMKDGVLCKAPDCTIIDYNKTDNILTLEVKGF